MAIDRPTRQPMRKGKRTRLRVIEAAAELLQRKGFNGTGLKEILKVSGAPKGSLYFHFPRGKEQLTCEALEFSGESWRGRLQDVIEAAPDPGSAIVAVCRVLGEEMANSGYERGCPVSTVTLEAAASSDKVRDTCSTQYRSWHGMILGLLAEIDVPAAQKPAMATLVLSSIEGALLLCRAYRDPTPLHHVGAMLRLMLESGAMNATVAVDSPVRAAPIG